MSYSAGLNSGLGLTASEWRDVAAGWQARAEAAEAALLAERERAGGAAATYFKGKLVICHPDIPAHVWDGRELRPGLDGAPAAS